MECVDCQSAGEKVVEGGMMEGVDSMMKRMGLRVIDRDGNEILMSEYLKKAVTETIKKEHARKSVKGQWELRNLCLGLNEAGCSVIGEGQKRGGRRKYTVNR